MEIHAYSLQLVQTEPLHLHDLVVAGAVVEGIGFLGKIIHDGHRI